jgi:hypothetical protein
LGPEISAWQWTYFTGTLRYEGDDPAERHRKRRELKNQDKLKKKKKKKFKVTDIGYRTEED